ncbi:hypothetical protein C8Q74DRAFT_1436582 [Fomes fomentarius]|nr:hypothetical protein C8Q74DRAFT_1436582 [Fomes fomentarius]
MSDSGVADEISAIGTDISYGTIQTCISDREINLFWQTKITGASMLFFVNRYLTLVVSVYWFPWWDFSTDYKYVPWALFSALRVYALRDKAMPLSILVFLLSSTTCITAVIYLPFFHVFSTPYPVICDIIVTVSMVAQQIYSVAIISRATLIIADVLVLVITWRATYQSYKDQGQSLSLTYILLRDGNLYFLSQLILNTFYFISLFTLVETLEGSSVNALAGMICEPLTSILVSRFLLDLQEAHQHSQHQHGLSSMSSIQGMDRVIGSLGSNLDAPGEGESDHTAFELHNDCTVDEVGQLPSTASPLDSILDLEAA